MNKPYPFNLLKKFSLVLVLVTIIAEIGIRVFILSPSNHIYDPDIGFRYRPHSELFLGTEGFARNEVNSLGLNDDEYNPNSKNKKMIVLGDSYTEAKQVDRKYNFTSLAESELQNWDVINAGRDGLHIINTYDVAKKLSSIVHPDLLVLVVSNGDYINDLSHRNIKGYVRNNRLVDVMLRVEAKEKLKDKLSWLVSNSALAVQVLRQYKPLIISITGQLRSFLASGEVKAKETKATEINRKPYKLEKNEMLSVLINKLRTIAPLTILYINQLEYETPQHVYPAKKPLKTSKEFKKVAQEKRVPFINTADYLIEQYFETKEPPFGFQNKSFPGGHLNLNGHKAVARGLVNLVKKMSKG